MKQTPARTRFKDYFGQANHYLVTALVALHQLEGSEISIAPAELHAAWNPRDKSASIYRTRIFTFFAILGSAVDAIDMYISLLYRSPNYIRDASLCSELDGAGRSVQKKVLAIAAHFEINPATLALIDVLITWRNNVVHELAENDLLDETMNSLVLYKDDIATTYRGLVPDQLPLKAKKGEPLTFKETASLINATHRFVEEVDSKVIAKLDVNELCRDLIRKEITTGDVSRGFHHKYNSLPPEKRGRFVRNWIANNYGITELADEVLQSCLQITNKT